MAPEKNAGSANEARPAREDGPRGVRPLPAKYSLGFTPTPLHALPNVSRLVGGAEFYMKRDDLTGLGLGGNKSRKLEYYFREALDRKATAVVTYGTPNSNHCRMTAAAAAQCGLKCVLILNGARPPARMSGNLYLDRLFGAELVFVDSAEIQKLPYDKRYPLVKRLREASTERVLAKLASEGHGNVYLVPAGGHGPEGALGYADAVKEILDQCRDQGLPAMDYLVTAFGSTGTFAGLWLGAKYHKAPFEVVGIGIGVYNEETARHTAEHIQETSDLYGMGVTCRREDPRHRLRQVRSGLRPPGPEDAGVHPHTRPDRRHPLGPLLHRQGLRRGRGTRPGGPLQEGLEGAHPPHRGHPRSLRGRAS